MAGQRSILSLREYLSVTEDNHLALHGVDLVNLCIEHGTPLFVFDEDRIAENLGRFRRAFESNYPRVIVCYSMKTNFNLAICKVIQEKGAYAEVTSDIELHAAEKTGFSGNHIIFDGPYKPREILQKALEKKVLLINVESFAEMERLDRVAGEMGVKQSIGLRVNSVVSRSFFANLNPKSLIHDIRYVRFGFSLSDAYSAFERASRMKNLRVEGIMAHNSPFYRGTVKTLLPLMHKVYKKLGVEIRYLNIGGGFVPETIKFVNTVDLVRDMVRQKFGLRSALDKIGKSGPSIEMLARSITDDIKKEFGDLPEATLVAEPGGFIVESSGIMLLRVDHVHRGGDGFNWIIVDGGTNLMPRMFPTHNRRAIIVANKVEDPRQEIVNIAGPLCYIADHIASKTYLPQIHEGDIIAIFDCGAYTLTSSNQFLHPRPAAVLLNSSRKVKVIREKETYEDVFRKDAFYDYAS